MKTKKWVFGFEALDAVKNHVGEHGGDPKSIALCHELGLSYVSCSPFRVPIARLAAAHAALLDKKKGSDKK